MLRKKVFIMFAAMVVSGCTDSEAVKTCRADLESSLKSPSSLKIVDTVSFTTDVEVTKARTQYILPKLLNEEKLAGNKTRVVPIYKVSFTYDADNSYGAALRDYHNCTMAADEHGLTLVERNIDKDPKIYQLSVEERAAQALEAAEKALEAAEKARN